MLMTWKKTAAGEIIYNKCPPNATGEGRRAGGAGWHQGSLPPSMCRFLCQLQTWLSHTGSASRRCLLSPHGVAYWGVPSFARCISREYRYLHLSVGARSGVDPPYPPLPSPVLGVCPIPGQPWLATTWGN